MQPDIPKSLTDLRLVMDALLQTPAGLSHSDISSVTGIPKGSLSRRLEQLQALGLVERHERTWAVSKQWVAAHARYAAAAIEMTM